MNQLNPSDNNATAIQSEPEYLILVLFAILCLLTIPITMQFDWPLSISVAVYIFVVAVNVYSMRKYLWGIVISGEMVSVSFPLRTKENASFLISKVDHVEAYRNPIRLFSYTDFVWLFLGDGSKIFLPRIGTKKFQSVENCFMTYQQTVQSKRHQP